MKTKKIPLRTCVVTKESLPKQELLRIVRTPYGEVLPDETGKLNGRGAYIKKDIEVLEKARKSKILDFLAFSNTCKSFLIYAPLPFNFPVSSTFTSPSGVLTILSSSCFGRDSFVTTQVLNGIFLVFM